MKNILFSKNVLINAAIFLPHRFMYEYSINYGQAPLPLLVGYAKSYLSMVGSCCTSPNPNVCFLKEVGVIYYIVMLFLFLLLMLFLF